MAQANGSLSPNPSDEHLSRTDEWLNMAFHEAERLWDVAQFSYRDELQLLELRNQGYSVREAVDVWFGRNQ